jgi:hypothetical protein
MVPTGIVDAALIPWPLVPATLIRSPLILSPLLTVPAVVVALAVLSPALPGVSGCRVDSDSQREGGQPECTGYHGSCGDFLQIHCEPLLLRLPAAQWWRGNTLTCCLKDLAWPLVLDSEAKSRP